MLLTLSISHCFTNDNFLFLSQLIYLTVTCNFACKVWNDVGIVKQTNLDEESAIDVEFHDTGLHHNFRMGNDAGHTLAALSREALVLACEATEDSPRSVHLVCATVRVVNFKANLRFFCTGCPQSLGQI
jgi:hypothetical protein